MKLCQKNSRTKENCKFVVNGKEGIGASETRKEGSPNKEKKLKKITEKTGIRKKD